MMKTSWENVRILLALSTAAIFLIYYISALPGYWNFTTLRLPDGLPIAPDFSNFWAASKLALSGKPLLAYNADYVSEIERQFLGTQHPISAFYYPPIFLLIVLPLGLMSYLPALTIWLGVTLLLYILVLIKISPHKLLIPFLVLFPGIYANFVFGQNAFLSGFLLGAGLLLLDYSPLIAGCFLGFLCYKPQFILLILIALLAGRYWKALIATVATSILLSIISAIVFGPEIWVAYFKIMSIPMSLLETGRVALSIMPSFFAATLSAGFNVKAAYLIQTIVMVMVLMGVVWVWWKKDTLALRGTILILGLLLFTPYAHIYELAILALPLCWLWEDGPTNAVLLGEFLLLLCTWLMPFYIQFLWFHLDIFQGKLQIGPPVLLLFFLFTLIKSFIQPKRTLISDEV